MGFTSVFGGNNIAPALPTYLPLSIAVNTQLGWPTELTAAGQPVLAEILDIIATVGGLSLQLSDARQSSTGYCALFNNVGGNTFTVIDNLGATLMTVASGQVWQIYLADNSTQGGTWRVFQFGAGVSSANAASLAGAGLKAISSTLNENIIINQQSVNYNILNNDRAACVEWTGGSGGVFTSPNPATVGSGWFCFVQNSGTGTVTFTPSSGTINGAASQVFQPFDSAIVVTDGTNFVTIGLGRAVASTFNFVQISLAGASGTVVLAGAQLNRISYRFTGALAGNTVVQVPGSIQQYWVDNETTGAFTLTFSSAGGGSSVVVAQGNKAILYCDGTNVVNAVTIPSVAAGGTNTQVQYNNAGAFGGSTMTYQVGTGAFAIAAPSSGVALTIHGNSTSGVLTLDGGAPTFSYTRFSTAGVTIGFIGDAPAILAGTPAGDFGIGGGGVTVRLGSGSDTLDLSPTGNVIINPPASGVAFTVNGTAGVRSATFNGVAGASYVQFNRSSAAIGYVGSADSVVSGGVSTDFGIAAQGGLNFGTNDTLSRMTISTAGDVVINAPTSGVALTINGLANSNTAVIKGASTSTQSFGLSIQAGTTFADYALGVSNQANTVTYFIVQGDGTIRGNGPIAAALVDMTPDSGSFTATFSGGYTANPTGTLNWRRMGNFVEIWCPVQISGTSNANTDISISGLPASITPATTGRSKVTQDVINAGGSSYTARAGIGTNGIIVLSILSGNFGGAGVVGVSPGASFSATSMKGVQAGWSVAYSI